MIYLPKEVNKGLPLIREVVVSIMMNLQRAGSELVYTLQPNDIII
jgi:hypothetical protein